MRTVCVFLAAGVGFGFLAAAGSVSAQTSELFVVEHGNGELYVLQNGEVVRGPCADPAFGTALAVTPNTVRVAGANAEFSRVFDHSCNLLEDIVNPETTNHFDDGTTDGLHNYGGAFHEPIGIYRFDLDWRNRELLFNPGAGAITYDTVDNTLWHASLLGSITEWTLDGATTGRVISTGGTDTRALAYDPADGTLWAMVDQTFRNWTTDGVELAGRAFVNPTGNVNIWAGEFAIGAPEIPTLSQWGFVVMTLLLLASGTLVFARRRRQVAT